MLKFWHRKPSLVDRLNWYGYPSWMFNPIDFELGCGQQNFREYFTR